MISWLGLSENGLPKKPVGFNTKSWSSQQRWRFPPDAWKRDILLIITTKWMMNYDVRYKVVPHS